MGSNARKRVHGGVVPNDIIRIFNDKVIGLSNLCYRRLSSCGVYLILNLNWGVFIE